MSRKTKGFLNEGEKKALIDKEKTSALNEAGMIKTASFNGSSQGPYPSPFLNLSDMQLPTSTIEVFKWCKYYYTFDPLISGAINALATFPVTEVHLEDDDNKDEEKSDSMKLYEKILFKNLNIYKLLIEIGIDYFLYGNCFVMGEMRGSKKGDQEWTNMIRLDPSKMVIDYNPATGKKTFKWQVPNSIKNIVNSKKPKAEYDKIPEIIKRAVRSNKAVVLSPNSVYHFSRATDSMGDNSVWGVPIVGNVLKLLMYRNILRQAQEAIAREHIVPMRIFYIDSTAGVNVQADWTQTAKNFSAELQKSVRDPNHKVVSPVPVNVINVGGEGRGLLLAPEIDQVHSEILAGMNVPREFIFGGVSYSGSSISLRILENQFITYRLLLKDFLQNFVIRRMAQARGEWHSEDDDDSLVTVKMTDLKMQDDVQQKQLIIQLNSNNKCSDDFMWKTMGIDSEKMKESLEKEALEAVELKSKVDKKGLQTQIEMVDLQTELQLKQMEAQMKIQQVQMQMQAQLQAQMPQQPQEQPQNQQGNADGAQEQPQPGQPQPQQPQQATDDEINAESERIALALLKQPEETREQVLSKMPAQVQGIVRNKMQELSATQQSQEAQQQVDMRPMPEQKPPRRESAQ